MMLFYLRRVILLRRLRRLRCQGENKRRSWRRLTLRRAGGVPWLGWRRTEARAASATVPVALTERASHRRGFAQASAQGKAHRLPTGSHRTVYLLLGLVMLL